MYGTVNSRTGLTHYYGCTTNLGVFIMIEFFKTNAALSSIFRYWNWFMILASNHVRKYLSAGAFPHRFVLSNFVRRCDDRRPGRRLRHCNVNGVTTTVSWSLCALNAGTALVLLTSASRSDRWSTGDKGRRHDGDCVRFKARGRSTYPGDETNNGH